MKAMKTVVAENLIKTYNKGAVKALDNLSIDIEEGTVLGVLGPNGAGKTTTVRILATLLKPDSGHATVGGIDVFKNPKAVREIIGLSGQYAAVDETLTGWDNLVMFGRLYHLSADQARVRARELLEQFSLTDAAKRPIKTFSGGMRRRLDLAASLIIRPKVLFLDEPTTGLDPRGRMEMWGVIEGLVKEGVTLLLTTQYLEEADQLSDDIAVIDRGTVIARGSSDELKDKVITLTPNEWLVPIKSDYKLLENAYLKGRTKEKTSSNLIEEAFPEIYSTWRARRDLNSRHPA